MRGRNLLQRCNNGFYAIEFPIKSESYVLFLAFVTWDDSDTSQVVFAFVALVMALLFVFS